MSGSADPQRSDGVGAGRVKMGDRVRVLGAHRVAVLAVIAGYLVLVLGGVTSSSMGMAHLTQDGATAGTLWSEPRSIRSDEYNANTPIQLSILATGGEPTLSPLSEDAGLPQRFASGPISSIVFFENAILTVPKFAPEAMRFAAVWWLPVLVLTLALPMWFHQLGTRRLYGWAAAGLVMASPSVAWWSMFPVRAVAYTLGGSALLLIGFNAWSRGSRTRAVVPLALAGLLIAGFPSFYVPWAIVLGLPVLVGSALWILTRHSAQWVDRLVPLAITGFVAASLAVALLWEFRDSLNSLLSTVYPGSRRSGPEAQPFEVLFGAPGLGPLTEGDPVGINASELATSFTVAFLVLAAILLAREGAWRQVDAATWSILGFGILWLGWSTVSLTSIGAAIPLLSSVPASRAAQVVGILAVIGLCLVLGRLDGLANRKAVALGLAIALVTAYATSLLASGTVPAIRARDIVLAALGAGVVTVLMTRTSPRRWQIALALIVAFLPVLAVNPLVRGLGDLRDSETAKTLATAGETARESGTLWVTDSGALAPALLANGVPALSGLQRSGPMMEQWLRIDPDRKFEQAWNRGGGYLGFAFETGSPWRVDTDGFDQIWVTVDPCVLVETFPEVSTVVSARDMESPCLVANGSVRWAGEDLTIYGVASAG